MLGTVLRIFVTTALAIAMAAAAAGAQTSTNQTEPAAPAPTPAPTATEGTFNKLSPGNQKIGRALFEAQKSDAATGSLTLDAIAQMKQDGKGWGQVFKEMKAQGLLQEKTLGQVVSRASRATRAGGGATTTGSGGSPATESASQVQSVTQPRSSHRGDQANHKGELEVKLKGLQFTTREEAQGFVDSLRQDGADRIRMKGVIDGQRFDARVRDHNGRIEQRLRIKEPKDGTLITTASGRSQVAGARRKAGDTTTNSRSFGSDHGGQLGDDHRPKLSSHGSKSLDLSRHSGSGAARSGRSGRGKD